MLIRRPYPDDLSDQEWNLIAPLVTFKATQRGRKGCHTKREMLNAIFYLLRTGCQWRHLPHDLPLGNLSIPNSADGNWQVYLK